MAKRRARGEGSLYFNEKKKLWVAQINLENGKTKTKYGKTQREVRDWLLQTRSAQKQGLLLEEDHLTLADFLDRYMQDVAAHTLRPKTIESYAYLVRMHIKPALGAYQLSALRPDHLQKLYSLKLSSGLSRRTVQYIHAVLHKTLDQAMKWGLVVRNVADLVDPPTVKRKAPQTLSLEQAKVFLEQSRTSRYYPLYALAIGCGLRIGEVLGLHHEDIDWDSRTLHIRHAVQYLIGQGLLITEPKTDKAKRPIRMPDFVVDALKTHCAAKKEKTGLLFTTSNHTPYSPRNLVRDFKQQLTRAGLPDIRFHDLRHTTATLLLSQGVHPKIVQEILGHSQISLTLDTYSHVTPSMQKEAAEKMSEMFRKNE